jgi:hypothetical protein
VIVWVLYQSSGCEDGVSGDCPGALPKPSIESMVYLPIAKSLPNTICICT